jgi:hypothetical protein
MKTPTAGIVARIVGDLPLFLKELRSGWATFNDARLATHFETPQAARTALSRMDAGWEGSYDLERRDYFVADVPRDWSEDPDERLDQAIREAQGENGLDTWVVPCLWQLVEDVGDAVLIVRISRPQEVVDVLR